MDAQQKLLRHLLATVAYRATRALEDAPEAFAEFKGGGRQPVAILAHMGDLFEWALTIAEGEARFQPTSPLPWDEEKRRFYRALAKFDIHIATSGTDHLPLERLLQGPVSDSLTHVGQLAMLRRMAECPTRGESFYAAEIAIGQVDAEQPSPAKPFLKGK